MKSVYRHLYIRNGYYYHRIGIPTYLHHLLQCRECIIALGTKDLKDAKITAIELSHSILNELDILKSELNRLCAKQSPNRFLHKFEKNIRDLKIRYGYKPNRFDGVVGQSHHHMSFKYIANKYLADCPADSRSTREHKVSTYDLFDDIVGDIVFKDVDIETARLFKSRLLKIPANAKKIWGVENFKHVNWDKLKTEKPQHPRTINNRLSYMSVLFNWAIKSGYYHDSNPFKGLMIPKSQKVTTSRIHPFKSEELKSLFESPLCQNSKYPSMFWVPLIGLYSGMRLNEICQLYVTDIRREQGIWIFDVNDDGNDKALKTSSSRRIVPIHNSLIEHGFLAYLESVEGNRD